ncbi:hypothetical protein [Nocardia callitridis]
MSIGPHDEGWAGIDRSNRVPEPSGLDRNFIDPHPQHSPDALLKAGFEQALVLVDAAEASGIVALGWFERAATECALAGIPIEAVHAVVSDGVTAALQRCEDSVVTVTVAEADCEREQSAEPEPDTLSGFLGLLNSAVSRAYAVATP